MAIQLAVAETKLTEKETKLLGTYQGWPIAYRLLEDRLRADAFCDRSLELLQPTKVRYDGKAVSEKMVDEAKPAKRRGYVLTPKAREMAKEFLDKHEDAFARSESETKVSKHLVASLLWIETKYGKNVGKHRAFSVLLSLAALSIPEFGKGAANRIFRQDVKKKWKVGKFADATYWENRAVKEVGEAWYVELKSFLEIFVLLKDFMESNTKYKMIYAIPGSFTGALGFGQFQPATALEYLLSADGTLREINLWDYDDTIQLVSEKLQRDGWTPESSDDQKRNAIRKYNRSERYVSSVWGLYRCLETNDPKICEEIYAESRTD